MRPIIDVFMYNGDPVAQFLEPVKNGINQRIEVQK